MSKNVMIGGKTYNGVSTVQLSTATGGTATFKDTDEITIPSGSKTITENGTFDVAAFSQAIVNVASSGGTNDSGMESGTFQGTGSNTVSIPVTSKKTHLLIWGQGNLAADYGNTAYATATVVGISGYGMWDISGNYSGAALASGVLTPESTYIDKTETDPNFTSSYCYFRDNSIAVRAKGSGSGAQAFYAGMTYNWLAW